MKCPHCKKEVFEKCHPDVDDLYEEPKELTPQEQIEQLHHELMVKHGLFLAMDVKIEKLQAKLEKYRWIPVEERLPEDITTVFVVCQGVGRTGNTGFYGEDENGWSWEVVHGINTNVTHWRPILLP